jgi:hypothetical protein
MLRDLKEEMKHCLLNFRYWHDEPGDDAMWFYSENHALMFHVCQLLAGELYPDEVFTNSGMTGARMQEKAVGLLRPWFETFFAIGFTEWNSPPYLPIDALGFASLYAQTSNQEMKDLARKAMDSIYYILAINSLDGIFCTTAGRPYPKELFGNNSNVLLHQLDRLWLGNTSHAGKGVTALCSPTTRLHRSTANSVGSKGKGLSASRRTATTDTPMYMSVKPPVHCSAAPTTSESESVGSRRIPSTLSFQPPSSMD